MPRVCMSLVMSHTDDVTHITIYSIFKKFSSKFKNNSSFSKSIRPVIKGGTNDWPFNNHSSFYSKIKSSFSKTIRPSDQITPRASPRTPLLAPFSKNPFKFRLTFKKWTNIFNNYSSLCLTRHNIHFIWSDYKQNSYLFSN